MYDNAIEVKKVSDIREGDLIRITSHTNLKYTTEGVVRTFDTKYGDWKSEDGTYFDIPESLESGSTVYILNRIDPSKVSTGTITADMIYRNPENDAVNHPQHYTYLNGIEVIDITEQMTFTRGNAVKYILRAGHKGTEQDELTDIRKAIWYLERDADRLEKELSN